jgi:cardiolipin synthase A/B
MSNSIFRLPANEETSVLRLLADQAFSRTAGAPLVQGNEIKLLRDARENYPAWMEAIGSAQRTIDFETYFIHPDKVGLEFADLLAAKARVGVHVRVIYDWLGARGAASWLFWRRLRKAGVDVRCFNPPGLDSPLEWMNRDHRKLVVVDGQVGFVSGLCVGQSWVGDETRRIEPWRDTGVKVRGPAVFDLERAFNQMWTLVVSGRESSELPKRDEAVTAGDASLRIVASEPSMAGLYRLDQLIAALAREFIWLTDAYFVGTPAYVQSLRAAAFDGVDVRLLLPRTSDIPLVRAFSRVGYRALLEAGVRIFEWNGSMLHAKTSVADSRWARVGSTNLNVASWMANYELDVVAEDEPFARAMEVMYLADLEHSTEIILTERDKVRPKDPRGHRRVHGTPARGSAGRAATGVLTIGRTLKTAITSPRFLGPTEAPLMFLAACLLLCVVALAIAFPRAVGIFVACLCGWAALPLLVKAFRLRFPSRK